MVSDKLSVSLCSLICETEFSEGCVILCGKEKPTRKPTPKPIINPINIVTLPNNN